MQLQHVTWTGPPADEKELLDQLPPDLAGLLRQIDGFIRFSGGLHVRGACREPTWHSLRDAWLGEQAYHRLYPDVRPDDVPFAQDCLGDQFLLRGGRVWRLRAETGEMAPLGVSLFGFLEAAQADPVEYLSMHPLLRFMREGGSLEPGQLLAAYPPFCTKQSGDGVSLRAMSADERRRFLAHFAAQIRDLPEGGSIRIEVVE
jgi:hypothetical protein